MIGGPVRLGMPYCVNERGLLRRLEDPESALKAARRFLAAGVNGQSCYRRIFVIGLQIADRPVVGQSGLLWETP